MRVVALTAALSLLGACRASHTTLADALADRSSLVGSSYANELSGARPGGEFEWWRQFNDPLLDELAERAFVNNYSLRELAATVRAQDADLRSSGAALGPTLDAEFVARRNLNVIETRNFGVPGSGRRRIYDPVLQPSLTVSWQADLFGRLRAAERSQLALLFAAENDHLALAHSLVASIVRERASLSVSGRRLEVAVRIADSRRETLDIVEGRYARGVGSTSAVDVRLARENLANAEAQLPALKLELARSRHALAELVGSKPGDFPPTPRSSLADLPPLAPPPAGLPARLLDRRPDLRAAEFRAEAAAASVDVAIAARYPSLVLSATGGWNANELHEIFDAETLFGNVVASLSANLFASGRLKAEVDAARARLEASAARYAATVIEAVREVEDALVAERHLREQLELVEAQRDEARRAEELARRRYRTGIENLLTVLETERRRATAETSALLLEQQVWEARTDLHLAIGGDWFDADADREHNARDERRFTGQDVEE